MKSYINTSYSYWLCLSFEFCFLGGEGGGGGNGRDLLEFVCFRGM